MKTKDELLELLAKVEKGLSAHVWDQQVEEPSELVPHDEMVDILREFDLPMPMYADEHSVHLPASWLTDEDPETSTDYQEVADKFFEIYSSLRYEFSREMEAFDMEAKQDEKDMHADFYRLVGWPPKN